MTIFGATELAVPEYVVFTYDDYLALVDKYHISYQDEHVLGDCLVIRRTTKEN